MKKVFSVLLAIVLVVTMAVCLSACSLHKCSICGSRKNVSKNDLGIEKLTEEYPYLCDECREYLRNEIHDQVYDYMDSHH